VARSKIQINIEVEYPAWRDSYLAFLDQLMESGIPLDGDLWVQTLVDSMTFKAKKEG
jgi:hypothetical protein